MKKLFFLCSTLLILCSCSKDDGKDIVDCIGESLFVNVKHTVEDETVNFKVEYSGQSTLKNTVTWDFGDGKVETITGNMATHIYSQSGSYKVKASVSIENPNCTFDLKEDVTIN